MPADQFGTPQMDTTVEAHFGPSRPVIATSAPPTADASPGVDAPAGGPLPWRWVVPLHLLPEAVMLGSYLALRPVAERLHLPSASAFTARQLLVLTPLLTLFLAVQGRRSTGRWTVLGALPYRRKLARTRLAGLVGVLVLWVVFLGLALSPVADQVKGHIEGWVPTSWSIDSDSFRQVGGTVAVVAVLAKLIVDGLVNPIAEELYFRGYLMPRLPVPVMVAPVVSAGLFAVQHLWQPQNWLLIFLAQVVAASMVARTRSVWVGAIGHCLVNSFGAVILLIGLA